MWYMTGGLTTGGPMVLWQLDVSRVGTTAGETSTGWTCVELAPPADYSAADAAIFATPIAGAVLFPMTVRVRSRESCHSMQPAPTPTRHGTRNTVTYLTVSVRALTVWAYRCQILVIVRVHRLRCSCSAEGTSIPSVAYWWCHVCCARLCSCPCVSVSVSVSCCHSV